jgi:predicted TIM-barrel fold metal-dependent hydrolase
MHQRRINHFGGKKVFDFSKVPYFDNHTHTINVTNHTKTSLEFTIPFLHGYRDILPENNSGEYGVSAELAEHITNLGAVKTMVNYLSQYFKCEPTLEAVLAERNRRSAGAMWEYASGLYADANIIGEMVDAGAPFNDPSMKCFPARIFRLFQMDPLFRRLLGKCSSYGELKSQFVETVTAAIREGFVGIKCHVLEVTTGEIRLVESDEAEKAFQDAKSGKASANETVYLAIFAQVLDLCQKLDIPIHIHTGCTGGPGNGLIHHCDPLIMAPFLNNPRFFNTTIVFLHCNYPNIRNAVLMAHAYPHVWIDLSWTLPWNSMNIAQCLVEMLGVAPHSKIMFGTGQHELPEMVWMASKIARSSLACVMEDLVSKNLISIPQAQETAEQLLYKNAKRLYRF